MPQSAVAWGRKGKKDRALKGPGRAKREKKKRKGKGNLGDGMATPQGVVPPEPPHTAGRLLKTASRTAKP